MRVDADAFNAFEAAGWATKATNYDRYFHAITGRLADPLLDAVRAAAGLRLLDVACGPGYVAGRAAERGSAAIGVDIAGSMVQLARELYPAAGFCRADAQLLPFADRTFDAVVGNLAILHFGRPEQALCEFVRVLVPGGRVALTVWDLPERARLQGVLLEAIREADAIPPIDFPSGPDFFRFADDREFAALFKMGGLTEVNVTQITFTHSATTSHELWNCLVLGTVRMAALVQRQPEKTRRRIRAGFDERLEEYRTAGAFALPVSFKLGAGRR